MNEITNVGNHVKAERLQSPILDKQGTRKTDGGPPARSEPVDQAEISELGRLLGLAKELPDIRAEKVAAARLAIGRDEEQFVKDRLEGTVNRLIDELLGG